MNPKQFLTLGGIVLVLVGILGIVGPIGPTAADSLFGNAWWFDTAENWAHLVLGIVALVAAFMLPENLQKTLVILVGVLALVVAVYNLMGDNTNLMGANLESPADLVLHLIVGIWALVAALGKKGSSMNMTSTM